MKPLKLLIATLLLVTFVPACSDAPPAKKAKPAVRQGPPLTDESTGKDWLKASPQQKMAMATELIEKDKNLSSVSEDPEFYIKGLDKWYRENPGGGLNPTVPLWKAAGFVALQEMGVFN